MALSLVEGESTEFGNINFRNPGICESCTSKDVRGFLYGKTALTHGQGSRLEIGTVSELQLRGTCWFCWTFYHLLKTVLDEDSLRVCCETNVPLQLEYDPGRWEKKVTLSEKRSACSRLKLERSMSSSFLTKFSVLLDSPEKGNEQQKLRQYSQPEFIAGSSMSLIRDWLDLCIEQHGDSCGQNTQNESDAVPIDLIDVTTRRIVSGDTKQRYVALSYVWGRTNSMQNEEREAMVAPELPTTGKRIPYAIPQTIADAIKAVQKLGERYLWVDAYCIPQADPDLRDYMINNMQSIYRGAIFTICAVSGKASDGGLAGVSRPHHRREQYRTHAGTETLLIDGNDLWGDLLKSVWMTRGWTFQEGLLSRRRLCFGNHGASMVCQNEIFWDGMAFDKSRTRATNGFETIGYNGIPSPMLPLNRIWNFGTYSEVISAYTGRDLTHDSDILRAVTGILNHIATETGIPHILGLPITDPPIGLLWAVRGSSTRRTEYPSWSWLGWRASVQYLEWLEPCPVPGISAIQGPLFRRVHPWPSGSCYMKVTSATILSSLEELRIGVLVARSRVASFKLVSSFHDSTASKTQNLCFYLWALHFPASDKPIQRENFHVAESTLTSTYSFSTNEETALRMKQAESNIFEFIMLQRWDEIDVERGDSICEKHGDRVWIMPIIRNADGTAERIGLLSIANDLWEAADPSWATIRLV